MLARQIRRLRPGLVLLQHPDDLIFREPRSLHLSVLQEARTLNPRGGKSQRQVNPFLSAEDILDTLFYCPHSRAELRALTAAREPRRDNRTDQTFADNQRAHFATANSNFRSLRLEYRMKIGQA